MNHTPHSKSLRFGMVIAVLSALAVALLFWFQINREYQQGLEDLTRRAQILAHRLVPPVRLALERDRSTVAAVLGERLDGQLRLDGIAVYDADGALVAQGEGLGERTASMDGVVREGLRAESDFHDVRRERDQNTHVFVLPVRGEDATLLGGIAVFHDAMYLQQRVMRGILFAIAWALGVGAVMLLLATGLAWAVFERPLVLLAEWMRRLRFANTPELPPGGLPVGKLADETVHLAASFRAARTKEREDAQDIVRSDKAWTRERLRAHAIDALSGVPLVVVSNREPYMHTFKDGQPSLVRPASGLVTGLDPVLRATGGLWVAHGAGDADRQTSDRAGCLSVPPEDPRYTLKRVWISKAEEQGYYYGFSNEGLWPLCHLTHERPTFRASDYEQYVSANQRFASAVLEEIGKEQAVVMVQDYQLALVPGMLKAARPDLRVGLFWHIPWPNAEAFRICPYRAEILQGMLGADLIGFHLQQHCNNFLETVDRMVEAKLDWDRFTVELKGHSAVVRPFPISVQPWSERGVASDDAIAAQIDRLRTQHQLGTCMIGVGVDRIDYTKGIAERFRAIERLFEKHPELRGKFSFVQLGAPSRTHIPRYRDLVVELEAMADEINWKFRESGGAAAGASSGQAVPGDWKPIHFLVDHHEGPAVYAFLKAAAVCIVSSLHDGMNLVAKEYVAAKTESQHAQTGDVSPVVDMNEGVLVLSEFAGAARDLPEALIINPYDTEEFADAIYQAITMDPRERRQRMTRMRLRVEEFNIYRWAAKFLTELARAPVVTVRSPGSAIINPGDISPRQRSTP